MKRCAALLAGPVVLFVAMAAAWAQDKAPGEAPPAEVDFIDFSLDLSDQHRPQDSIVIRDRPGPAIEVNFSTELIGGDYDSGLTNPLLGNITSRVCHMMCVLDDRCKAYTHDGPTDICTLKGSVGEKRARNRSLSTIMVDREVVTQSQVVYRGWANMKFDAEQLNWRLDDTAESFVKRTRDAAQAFGGSCEQERQELSAVRVVPNIEQSGTVGQYLRLSWDGNGLRTLIPVWMVVSTTAPIRVSGKGVYALAPGARGPFGLDDNIERTRAVVALYNHAAGESGDFGIMPLAAGELPVTAKVIAYLRACQEFVELISGDLTVAVQPAAPRLVVSDPFARNQYTEQADIAGLGRRVLYNKTRFLIVETDLGSEILERNGTDIRFSPTGRFLVVRSGEGSDIIDVVDGAVVARIGDNISAASEPLWFHNDSFVAISRGPWGRVWLAPTLKLERPAFYYQTEGACCDMSNDQSLIDVNLENNVVRLWGGIGGAAVNLMDFEIGADMPGMSGFDNTFAESMFVFFDAMGPVSALPNALGFNRPFPTSPGTVAISPIEPELAAAPPSTTELGEMRGAVSLIPAQDYLQARPRGIELSQFGLETAPETEGAAYVSPDMIADWGTEYQAIQTPETDLWRQRLADHAGLAEIEIEWMLPTGEMSDQDCGFILDANVARPAQLPGVLDIVQMLPTPRGVVWIVRSRCHGGGTSATQSFRSALMIIDEARLKGRPARDSIVEENATDGTQFDYKFFDANFQTKLVGDHTILFYMPGGGAIGLYDLETRQFTWQRQRLARGDLLSDAHLSADGRTVLQVNADQSFALLDVAGSRELVEGRQVDGETVFWTPDFRFDSTAEGASYVELRFPGLAGQYTFQQFDTRLRRAGLLAAALGGQLEASPVSLHAPPRLRGTLAGDAAELFGEAVAQGTMLREIRLYQDGILTDVFPAAASGAPVAVRAKRLAGARWATLVAADDEGLVSLPIGRDLGATGALTRTQLLAIGVNAYDDERLPDLSLSRADAENLDAALKSLDGGTIAFDAGASAVLTDGKATRDAILDAARKIVEASSAGDNIVIAFSGHGFQDAGGRFYLALSSSSLDDIAGSALAWDELAKVLSGARGRVTVLLDACHSGSAGTGLLASNDEAVASIRATIPTGLTVLAASKGRELSAEIPSLGGGVFNHVLAKGITVDRAAADRNANGRIEVSELYRYVKDNVSALRKGEQTPWLSRNQMVGDFALF